MKYIITILSTVIIYAALLHIGLGPVEMNTITVSAQPPPPIVITPGTQPNIRVSPSDTIVANRTIVMSIHEPSAEPVPFLQPATNPKSLFVKFHMNNTVLEVKDIKVVYGWARTYIADPDQFRITLKDFKGQDLFTFRTYDPLATRVYVPLYAGPSLNNTSGINGTSTFPLELTERSAALERVNELVENYTRLSESDGEFIIPFTPRLNSLEFTDSSGKFFGSVEVNRQIGDFCRSVTVGVLSTDSECINWLNDRSTSSRINLR